VAVIFGSSHAQVKTLFVQSIEPALVSVHEDLIVLASVIYRVNKIVIIPALTALGTVMDIGALAFGEAWSCFSPH